MKKKRSIIPVSLLTSCLITAMIPATVFASGEDINKAVQLGTGEISGYSDTDGYNYIYFGTWENASVKWRVLDDETNTGENGLFLLSDELLGTGENGGVAFDKEGISNVWQGSDAQAWCIDFYENKLTDIEKNCVISTVKNDPEYQNASATFGAVNNILNEDKIFFLSAEETESAAYGFASPDDRKALYNGLQKNWWLRSPSIHTESVTGPTWGGLFVGFLGEAVNGNVNGGACARPAFNMSISTVLLTTAAINGKASGEAGVLSAVSDYTGSEWKLTLLDSSRSFTANVNGQTRVSALAGESLQIAYSGAQTGDNEYVSALLCDDDGNVLCYGNIAQNSANGTATLNIPSGLAVGSYTLKIFSEQCNGDYKTDYASVFQDVLLNILPQEAMPQASFNATGDNDGILSDVDTSMKYSTDGGASWKNITGTTIELTGVTAANDVKVYKPGNGTTTADSTVQTIDITQAVQPAVKGVDCTTSEQNNGQITGVDNTMEYKLSAASEWMEITGTEVTGLVNGTYDVRVKANGTVLASSAVTITIGGHICVAQGEWQYDANEHWKLCHCGAFIDEAEHTFQWVTDKAAAATEAGSRHEECTVCGYEKAAVAIPATGIKATPSPSGGGQSGTSATSSPNTGDDTSQSLWACILTAACLCMAGAVWAKRRRKQDRL